MPSGQIKQYLISKGPLSVAMGVSSGYGGGFDAQGVYRCSNDSGANHPVIVVGYSDADGYWIVKNSWGAGWNGDGYFKVGYDECAIQNWPYYVDVPAPRSTPTPSPSPTPGPFIPGDANGDGQVAMGDAMLTARCAVGVIDCGTINETAVDLDRSGETSMSDAMLVAQRTVGLIGPFTTCPP